MHFAFLSFFLSFSLSLSLSFFFFTNYSVNNREKDSKSILEDEGLNKKQYSLFGKKMPVMEKNFSQRNLNRKKKLLVIGLIKYFATNKKSI